MMVNASVAIATTDSKLNERIIKEEAISAVAIIMFTYSKSQEPAILKSLFNKCRMNLALKVFDKVLTENMPCGNVLTGNMPCGNVLTGNMPCGNVLTENMTVLLLSLIYK
jgi:hypothetical protein